MVGLVDFVSLVQVVASVDPGNCVIIVHLNNYVDLVDLVDYVEIIGLVNLVDLADLLDFVGLVNLVGIFFC